MPYHIFTRLGLWRQSIDANTAAIAAALGYVREELGPDAFDGETVHSMDYLEYADLQIRQDRKAKRLVEDLRSFGQAKGSSLPMAYALAAIPARYAIERRNWSEAASLTTPAIPFFGGNASHGLKRWSPSRARSARRKPVIQPAPRPRSRSCNP
jgi:hypothetical protein